MHFAKQLNILIYKYFFEALLLMAVISEHTNNIILSYDDPRESPRNTKISSQTVSTNHNNNIETNNFVKLILIVARMSLIISIRWYRVSANTSFYTCG